MDLSCGNWHCGNEWTFFTFSLVRGSNPPSVNLFFKNFRGALAPPGMWRSLSLNFEWQTSLCFHILGPHYRSIPKPIFFYWLWL